MTIITIDSAINLPKTHFHDMQELVEMLIEEYDFKKAVEESVEKNDPGVLYETDREHGIFFPKGISPGELLRVFETSETNQSKTP